VAYMLSLHRTIGGFEHHSSSHGPQRAGSKARRNSPPSRESTRARSTPKRRNEESGFRSYIESRSPLRSPAVGVPPIRFYRDSGFRAANGRDEVVTWLSRGLWARPCTPPPRWVRALVAQRLYNRPRDKSCGQFWRMCLDRAAAERLNHKNRNGALACVARAVAARSTHYAPYSTPEKLPRLQPHPPLLAAPWSPTHPGPSARPKRGVRWGSLRARSTF
jgi:hypothetical protein